MPVFERVSADIPVTIKNANYTVVSDDNCTEIQFENTSALAANLSSVTALANGFNVILRNIGAGNVTVDPSGSETIDGAATLALATGDWRWIRNDGTTWKSISANLSTTLSLQSGRWQAYHVQFRIVPGLFSTGLQLYPLGL